MPVETISPAAAAAELAQRQSIRLIDVRMPMEFAQIHARGAINVPLDELDPSRLIHGDAAVYFICRAGTRGQLACARVLEAMPTARVVHIDGGTLAWEAAGLPVIRGRPRQSSRRLLRGAVGLLITASIVLAIFVHKGLLGIAALVGAGLIGAALLNWFDLRAVFGIGKRGANTDRTSA